MVELQYGRYETVGLIASGGMADVYLGRARGPAGFERMVAIKVMHEHIARDPEFETMFLDEARLAARIRHPNVVPTLDVSEDGHIIVMEYVEGASLNGMLVRDRRLRGELLPLAVTLRIVLDLLDGLHAAHELREKDRTPLNLVHRDVSPHNVLVGIDGVTRITDFGIAYAESRLTSTQKGKLKGKMPYMAPEQLEGADVDRRVDVYAAGCVLWEMLTGQRLFQADNEAALACRVLAGPELSPREVNGAVPPALAGACMRALEERSRRYGTALEFCEAIEEAARKATLEIARARAVGAYARKATVSIGSIMEAGATTTRADGERPTGEPPDTDPVSEPVPPTPATVPAPNTVDLLGVSATAELSRPDVDDEMPLAGRPVFARVAADEPAGSPSDSAATLVSGDSAPDTKRTLGDATDGSIVAPVSVERRRDGARWALAVAVAAALVGLAGWLLFRSGTEPEPTADATTQPPEPATGTEPEPASSGRAQGPRGGGGAAALTNTAQSVPTSTPDAAGAKTGPREPGRRTGPALSSSPAAPQQTSHRLSPPAPATNEPTPTPSWPTASPPATSTVFHPPRL